jgi:1,4-alpha-glucan branching enzyme
MNTLVPVTFQFPGSLVPLARRVAIIGPFNGWRGNSHRLMRIPGGDWIITVFLPPGRVVYGFDVDGTRWPDPQGEDRVSTGAGSEYSVRHVSLGMTAPGVGSGLETGR